jgi:two-component system OmpR family response regulator
MRRNLFGKDDDMDRDDRWRSRVPSKAEASRRILIVESESSVVDSLATVLTYEGFEVEVVHSGRSGLERARKGTFDLVVFDLMIPDIDDIEVTHRNARDGLMPPVLYISEKQEEGARISSFGGGKNSYVTKPFSLQEVVVKANAMLGVHRSSKPYELLRFADLVMDEKGHKVWRRHIPVHLTATEFDLLRLFLTFPCEVLSKEQILDYVWHYRFDGHGKIVESYVRQLRRKLDPLGAPLIHTIRLVGYVLREER